MSTPNYPEIKVQDIREGDKIRVDLTNLELSRLDYIEYTADCDEDEYNGVSTHYLIERPVEITTGMIIQSVSDPQDYWIRTGANTWAGVYLGIRQFYQESAIGDQTVRNWLENGDAKVVDRDS